MRSRIGWRSRLSRMRGSTVQFDLGRYDAPLAEIARVEGELGGLTDSDLLRANKGAARYGPPGRDARFCAQRVVRDRARDLAPCTRPAAVRRAGRGQRSLSIRGMLSTCSGEGKTLAAVMPAAWNALGGKGVHVTDVQRLPREARCRVDGTDLPSARIVGRLRAGGDERGGTARCIPC